MWLEQFRACSIININVLRLYFNFQLIKDLKSGVFLGCFFRGVKLGGKRGATLNSLPSNTDLTEGLSSETRFSYGRQK